MAVTLTQSAEGVTPSGTTLTAGAGGNTGGVSGNFFDTVNIGTGCAVVSDSAHAAHGSLSVHFTSPATAATAWAGWSTSLTAGTITLTYLRFYQFLTAYPASGTWRIGGWFNSTGTICGSLRVSTTGILTMANSANTAITGMASTVAIPLNAWCRVEAFCNSGTGACEQQLFTTNPDGTTADDIKNATAQSLLADCGQVRFGMAGSPIANYSAWQDDFGASDTAYVGPAVSPVLLPQQLRRRVPALTPAAARARATYGR